MIEKNKNEKIWLGFSLPLRRTLEPDKREKKRRTIAIINTRKRRHIWDHSRKKERKKERESERIYGGIKVWLKLSIPIPLFYSMGLLSSALLNSFRHLMPLSSDRARIFPPEKKKHRLPSLLISRAPMRTDQFDDMCFRIIISFRWCLQSCGIARLARRVDRNIFNLIRFDYSNGVVDQDIIVRPTNHLIHARTDHPTLAKKFESLGTNVFLMSRNSAWPMRLAFKLTNEASLFFSASFSIWRFFN